MALASEILAQAYERTTGPIPHNVNLDLLTGLIPSHERENFIRLNSNWIEHSGIKGD